MSASRKLYVVIRRSRKRRLEKPGGERGFLALTRCHLHGLDFVRLAQTALRSFRFTVKHVLGLFVMEVLSARNRKIDAGLQTDTCAASHLIQVSCLAEPATCFERDPNP